MDALKAVAILGLALGASACQQTSMETSGATPRPDKDAAVVPAGLLKDPASARMRPDAHIGEIFAEEQKALSLKPRGEDAPSF